MLRYLFISYYKLFLRTRDSTPIFAAACALSLTIILWILLVIFILNKFISLSILSTSLIEYFFIALYLMLIFLLYRFFKKDRVDNMLEWLESKPSYFGKISILVAILTIIIPFISIGILLKK